MYTPNMDLNDFEAFLAMPVDEPMQFGGIKVATNTYESIPESLYVMIWDDYRMLEKEYDIHTGKLLSRQVSNQQGDIVYGERLEKDNVFHKYAITETWIGENTAINKEYHDGELINEEHRKVIVDQNGKIIKDEWMLIRYVNGIPSEPKYSTIEYEA